LTPRGTGFQARLGEIVELSPSERLRATHLSVLIVPLAWELVQSYPFKWGSHINLLEGLALLKLVESVALKVGLQKRLIMLVDSAVVKGAGSKGRSSSPALNRILRRLTGLALGLDLYIEIVWIPSWSNVADAPTREYSVDE
jgi:hypothetical protein